MVESSQKMDHRRLKNFVRHLCVIAKKHKDREEARDDLGKQIKKLRRFSSKKKEMDEELKELERKVSLVLDKEMQLLGMRGEESAASRELMRNVYENREKISQIKDSISELKGKLDNYIQMKTERERRINKLERKIKGEVGMKRNISLLKDRLNRLEAIYNRLKERGMDVSGVENRIEDLKLRLMA